MDTAMALGLIKRTLITVMILNTPVLAISLVVGLLIAIVQTTTQVQEQTLTFVPKVFAIIGIIVLMSDWMLKQLVTFTVEIFDLIAELGH